MNGGFTLKTSHDIVLAQGLGHELVPGLILMGLILKGLLLGLLLGLLPWLLLKLLRWLLLGVLRGLSRRQWRFDDRADFDARYFRGFRLSSSMLLTAFVNWPLLLSFTLACRLT